MKRTFDRHLWAYTALSVLTPPILSWSAAFCVTEPSPRYWWLFQLILGPFLALPCLIAAIVALRLKTRPRDSLQRNAFAVGGMLGATYAGILVAHVGMLVLGCRYPDGYSSILALL